MSELYFVIVNKKYLYAKYNAFDGEVMEATGIVVEKADYEAGKISRGAKLRKNRLELVVNDFSAQTINNGHNVLKADVENIIRTELGKKTTVRKSGTLGEKFSKYLQAIRDGEITNRDKKYSGSVVNILEHVGKHITANEWLASKDINKLTYSDLEKLKKYLTEKNLSQNTIRVYLEYAYQFLKQTHKRGWHQNTVYETVGLKPAAEEQDFGVYLNNEEIKHLYSLEFTYSKEARKRIRDYFVFGCLTGLRFNDIKRAGALTVNSNKLAINTQKRGQTVLIPLGAMALEIWNRYGGKFHDHDNHTFNTSLRRICKQAGFTEKILWVGTRGGKKLQIEKPRYECCSSHTMRRSFATNAYRAGIAAGYIMKITGHKTESSFMRYIRLSHEENVTMLQQHPHFQ